MEESTERLTKMMQDSIEGTTKQLNEIQETLQIQNERITKIEQIRDNASGSQQGSHHDERASTISETQSKRGTASGKSFLAAEHDLYAIAEEQGGKPPESNEEVEETVQTRVFRNAASIRATVGQHSGKEEDHEHWMDTLKS